MINIDNKPHMRTEYFRGTITLALHEDLDPIYGFQLLRHTNGTVKHEIRIDAETQLSADHIRILTDTIIANISKDQINWKPQEKEGKS
jgi:hypothetical protein